jgi:hypothetical protein
MPLQTLSNAHGAAMQFGKSAAQRFGTVMVAFLLVHTPVLRQDLEPSAQSDMQPL